MPATFAGIAGKSVQASFWNQWLLTFGIFSLICFVVLYFNDFHPLLQMAISLSGVLCFSVIGSGYRSKNEAAGLGFIWYWDVLDAWVLAYICCKLHELDHGCWKAGSACSLFAILDCVLVLVLAFLASFLRLDCCLSCLCLASLAITLDESPAWYEIQLYWLPLDCVFGWCSWFFHRWSRQVAAILFVAGA